MESALVANLSRKGTVVNVWHAGKHSHASQGLGPCMAVHLCVVTIRILSVCVTCWCLVGGTRLDLCT